MALKVFKLNDYDWWAAETLEAAIADYRRDTGVDADELADARELTDAELDRLRFRDPDTRKILNTFRAELEALNRAGVAGPVMFASTEI
jgi:hypothetical protein